MSNSIVVVGCVKKLLRSTRRGTECKSIESSLGGGVLFGGGV